MPATCVLRISNTGVGCGVSICFTFGQPTSQSHTELLPSSPDAKRQPCPPLVPICAWFLCVQSFTIVVLDISNWLLWPTIALRCSQTESVCADEESPLSDGVHDFRENKKWVGIWTLMDVEGELPSWGVDDDDVAWLYAVSVGDVSNGGVEDEAVPSFKTTVNGLGLNEPTNISTAAL